MQQRPEQGRWPERPSCHAEPHSSRTRRAHCLPASPGAPSQCLPVSLPEDPRVKTQFSWSRTFTPLHAHVQPGPLPSQVQLPVGPTPTRQSRQQPRGYETGGISKPGHLPSNGRVFLALVYLPARRRGAKNPEPDVRVPVSDRRNPSAGPRAPGRRLTDSGYHGIAEGQKAARGQRSR